MAGLWWMTVTLVCFLSVGSVEAVDQNKLATLIKKVLHEYYMGGGMFSLALSIPSEDPVNAEQLFIDNPKAEVEKQITDTDSLYKGQRLVVAKVQQPEHAEWRLFQNLNLVSNPGDLLIIYSHASPCYLTCTNTVNPYNIITKIKEVIAQGNWGKYIFVFKIIFQPNKTVYVEKDKLETALKDLGTSGITLANIFRCYKPVNQNFMCTSCSTGGEVTQACVDYNA